MKLTIAQSSHIQILRGLDSLPFYSDLNVYPLNAILVTTLSAFLCFVGKKTLGKFSWYLAL